MYNSYIYLSCSSKSIYLTLALSLPRSLSPSLLPSLPWPVLLSLLPSPPPPPSPLKLLDKIRKGWAETSFATLNHREQSDVFILGGIDEVIMQLEDSQVALQTILASRFVGGIRTEVEEWEKKLSLLSEMLDEWLACQRSWMYLENIFGAEDIQKQLPAESSKFMKINKFF